MISNYRDFGCAAAGVLLGAAFVANRWEAVLWCFLILLPWKLLSEISLEMAGEILARRASQPADVFSGSSLFGGAGSEYVPREKPALKRPS